MRVQRGRAVRAVLVACLAAALLLPATGSAQAQDAAPPSGLPGVAVPELAWGACDGLPEFVGPDGAPIAPVGQCTTTQVPLDYAEPDGETIEIALARHRATDPDRRIGSLFVNFGGPGGGAVDTVALFGDLLFDPEVTARFDIVGVDPRGVARSTPVECFATDQEAAEFFAGVSSLPLTVRETARRIANDAAFSARCAAAAGDLLDNTSTTQFVRDLDLLRAAVGDDALTFVGYSYGTYVGSVYANLFPQRVRALVLDAVLDPVDYTSGPRGSIAAVRLESDEGAYATLLQFFRTCEAAAEGCAFSEGDPEAKYAELAARLREEPIVLETPDGPFEVGYDDLVLVTLSSLYSPFAWPDLAAALQELSVALPAGSGAGSAHARLQARIEDAKALTGGFADEYTQGLEGFSSVFCLDTDNPRNPLRWPQVARQRDRVVPYFGAAWTWVGSECATWRGEANDRYTGPWTARTANPVLVVGERYDPATNYQSAVKLNGLLPNSTLLTLDGYGHTAQASVCVDTAVATYLLSVATPPSGTVCQQDVGPFDPLPTAPAAELEAVVEEAIAIGAAPAAPVPTGD